MIKQSSGYHADIVVFPELSMTGYELDLAAKLAFSPEPSNFKELSQASVENQIIVIAGCPLQTRSSSKPTIGAVVCFPNGAVEFYSKQYLHPGEENFCSCGATDYLFNINGYQIALAICADFTKPEHSKQAKKLGADIYLVSALISEKGYAHDSKILSEIASGHGFPVLLSNHISETGGWKTGGKSSAWNSHGECVIEDSFRKSGLIYCTISGNEIEVTKT
jgi:predicted amidohydrolase